MKFISVNTSCLPGIFQNQIFARINLNKTRAVLHDFTDPGRHLTNYAKNLPDYPLFSYIYNRISDRTNQQTHYYEKILSFSAAFSTFAVLMRCLHGKNFFGC
jgi:hypothetical protein